MYSENAVFVITERGLEVLKNNELPPSVLTSILRLADSSINLKTFSIYLKEHGDIQPFFEFLHNEGFIEQLAVAEEILVAPTVEQAAQDALLLEMKQTEIFLKAFDIEILRKTVLDYINAHHPHVIFGINNMLDTMHKKQDFINHRDVYSRLIAGDTVHALKHMAELDAILALPELLES